MRKFPGSPLAKGTSTDGGGQCLTRWPLLQTQHLVRRCQTIYYRWFIKTYARDTYTLTWLEDCAYRRLIDICYETERDLPRERAALYVLVRATSTAEKRAVDKVLKKFFKQRGGKGGSIYHQRVSKDLATYQQLQTLRSTAAKQRWIGHSKSNASAYRMESYPNSYKPLQSKSPPTSHATPAREASGQDTAVVEAWDANVIVHKPRNRRLFTANERDALNGMSAREKAQHFINKGFNVEIIQREPNNGTQQSETRTDTGDIKSAPRQDAPGTGVTKG